MLKAIFFLLFLACLVSLSAQQEAANWVNPMIGTGGHGHTFPGATLPFGGVQLSPDTDDTGWDWCSGYNYADASIMGFSHTHLSGTGISDLADILIMPYIGSPQLLPGEKEGGDQAGYRSAFSHDTELASPGYYRVLLEKQGILAELTVDEQHGYHRYTFPDSDSAKITIDLQHGLDRHRTWLTERVLDAELIVQDTKTLRGHRISSGWANVQAVYFEIKFSQAMTNYGLATNEVYRPQSQLAKGRNVKGVFGFSTQADQPLEVVVRISYEPLFYGNKALDTLLASSFEAAREKAAAAWQKELEAVSIDAADSVKTILYTALYHTALAPNHLPGTKGRVQLSTFSNWDTYRAAFALHTLLRPQLVDVLLHTMLLDYQKNGYLPVWKLWEDEVNCMIGTPAVPIVVEAILKGHTQNQEALLEAVHSSLTRDNPVAPWTFYDRYGYVPNDVGEAFSVSKTLEMAYANGCAALLAKALGEAERADFYQQRAAYYRQVFDSVSGFFRGKDREGEWSANFDPRITNEAEFVEATPWQYRFHAQHDIAGLIELLGGPAAFEQALDQLFAAGPAQIDEHILDITGLIGQYAQGNEPSHHIAYLYNYIGRHRKAQRRVQQIARQFYSSQADGLCGNEDCGQLSAWYVFAALGFYPVHPASGYYDIGLPLVDRASIRLGNGKTLVISRSQPQRDYADRVYFNGRLLSDFRISHEELMQGGALVFD